MICDPVTLEIIRGAVRAAQAEMEALLERTAISAFIREKKDFYTAVFDAAGRLAVGSNVPIFGDVTAPVLAAFPPETMQPGDLYWFNDCYGSQGAVSHSNDQVFLAPIFHAGELSAFVMGWAHFADIGGLRPGSISPDTTDIFQEGIIVPPTRLVTVGVLNEAALNIFHRNSRFPAAKPRRHERADGECRGRGAAHPGNPAALRRTGGGGRAAPVAGADRGACAPVSQRNLSCWRGMNSLMQSIPTGTATARSICAWR